MAVKCPKCQAENPETNQFCADCGTKLPIKVMPLPGVKDQVSVTRTLEISIDELTRGILFVGRYEIIEELGAGGMGKVYRAFDKKIEEEVALKLLKPEIAADKKTVDRFRNELKLARKIRHSNDIYARSFYMFGKTNEQQGKKGKARETDRKFLDLWKDGDPGLPEGEDAKKRLAAIS